MSLPGHTKDEWLRSWTYLCLNKPLDLFKAPNSTSYNLSIEKQGPEKTYHVPRIFIHSGSLAKAMNSGSKINRIFNAANWEKNHYDIPFLCWLYEARFFAAPTSVFLSGRVSSNTAKPVEAWRIRVTVSREISRGWTGGTCELLQHQGYLLKTLQKKKSCTIWNKGHTAKM